MKRFKIEPSTTDVDQSKHFLGGRHHPWRRLFARMVDICTVGPVLFLLLIVENPIVAYIVLHLVWLLAEALLLSLFGTTPAKWLFGIRVEHPGGNLLSFSEALNRSFLVFVQGLGFGIAFVSLFTQFFAYRRLTKTGTTLWDTSVGAVVLHKKWGVVRALVCPVAVFGVLILLSIALNAGGNR